MEQPLWELDLMAEESTVLNPEKSALYRETVLTKQRRLKIHFSPYNR